MTDFYGLPNGEFWHWANALHFVLVGVAGGLALLAALLHLNRQREAERYTLLAVLFIALDLFVLWAESGARWRFSQVWLFLSFNPEAPLWWGAWGLLLAFLSAGMLLLRPLWKPLEALPVQLLAGVLLAASLVALFYPGFALAVNSTRPLWNPLLVAFFPVTAVFMVLGVASLLGSGWARSWLLGSAALTLLLTLAYPLTLGVGGFGLFAKHALAAYGFFAGVLLPGEVFYRNPTALAGLGLLGVVGLRALLVLAGQVQGFGL